MWAAKGWITEERRRGVVEEVGDDECARERLYESLKRWEGMTGTMMFLWLCVLPPAGVPSAACSPPPPHTTPPCIQTPPRVKPSYVHTNLAASWTFTVFCLFVCLVVCLDQLCLQRKIQPAFQGSFIHFTMAHQFQQTTEDKKTARDGNDEVIQLGWTTVTTVTVLQIKTS